MLNTELSHLAARLPELEWKLSLPGVIINSSLLPRGLFRSQLEWTAKSCIDEIKADLQTIKQQENEKSIHYLAERVEKKINVLVRLCKKNTDLNTTERHAAFGIQALSTRQQWLQTMQKDIDVLSKQHQALEAALITLQADNNNTQAILSLQVELGNAERRLTLAKETLARSTTL